MIEPNKIKPLKSDYHMSGEQIEDEQRLVEASKSDPVVFGKLYDRYFEGIFQFIYRRTDSEELSDDLASQTFLKALQNLKKYEYRGLPFAAWLYRIASNEINKYYNKNKRNRIFSIEESRVYELFEESEQVYDEEDITHLLKVLGQMSTNTVEVLELRFFEDRSFKEIAYILNITESGAKMRLYRAVEKLKQHFNRREA